MRNSTAGTAWSVPGACSEQCIRNGTATPELFGVAYSDPILCLTATHHLVLLQCNGIRNQRGGGYSTSGAKGGGCGGGCGGGGGGGNTPERVRPLPAWRQEGGLAWRRGACAVGGTAARRQRTRRSGHGMGADGLGGGVGGGGAEKGRCRGGRPSGPRTDSAAQRKAMGQGGACGSARDPTSSGGGGGGGGGPLRAPTSYGPPPPSESLWLLEAPVRKVILQMHTPARTGQCWSRQTPARTRRVHLDAPGQRHGQQPRLPDSQPPE